MYNHRTRHLSLNRGMFLSSLGSLRGDRSNFVPVSFVGLSGASLSASNATTSYAHGLSLPAGARTATARPGPYNEKKHGGGVKIINKLVLINLHFFLSLVRW